MDWIIVIPSYQRAPGLKDKTLALLLRYNIPKEKITIFCANEEEAQIYQETLPEYKIIVGVPGLHQQRNFISLYYPVGTKIVSLDDDLTALCLLEDGKIIPHPSLLNLIDEGFKQCEYHHYHLWGIAPVCNPFFMKDIIHTDLKFCIGHLYGYINRHLQLKIQYKDDYEMTLKNAVLDKGVIRFSGVAAKTRLGAAGGLNTSNEQRLQTNIKNIQVLMSEYPGLVRLNKKRPGEILLSRRIKT
jgi:hypothetical protein